MCRRANTSSAASRSATLTSGRRSIGWSPNASRSRTSRRSTGSNFLPRRYGGGVEGSETVGAAAGVTPSPASPDLPCNDHGGKSPILAEGPYFDVERPGGPVLMRGVKNLVGDGRRLDEEAVGPILEALARPRHVDHRVDDDIGDVHTLRPHVAR